MAGRYAASTDVTAERSQAEVERILRRYGADQFIRGWDLETATIGFRIRKRQVKLTILMPDPEDPEFTEYTDGWGNQKLRSENVARDRFEQATRQRWRALTLYLKATLEAIEVGIVSIESAFLPYTMLKDGRTVTEWLEPQIALHYQTGNMPPLLPSGRKD